MSKRKADGGGGEQEAKKGKSGVLLWLRDEVKPGERRAAITPENAKKLLSAGFSISVEQSTMRCFPDSDYESAGCTLVAPGSWVDAPASAIIVGLKELPAVQPASLSHRHTFFCHAFKGQAGWRDELARFRRGGGTLYDLEYLTFPSGRRVAAFGRAAGMVGGALAAAVWAAQADGAELPPLEAWPSQLHMVAWAKGRIGDRQPTALVMGALGRSGRGACDVLEAVGVRCTRWDLAETKAGGPFDETLQHDILVNCILLQSSIPPFVTREMVERDGRQLSVIVDVSCDNSNPWNPIPFLNAGTTLSQPTVQLAPGLVGCAIDHLPTLLPREASEGFGADLLPHLMEIPQGDVWKRAEGVFKSKMDEAKE